MTLRLVSLLGIFGLLMAAPSCNKEAPPAPASEEPAASAPAPAAPEPAENDPFAELETEEDLEEEAAELINENNLDQRLAEIEKELETEPAE